MKKASSGKPYQSRVQFSYTDYVCLNDMTYNTPANTANKIQFLPLFNLFNELVYHILDYE